MKSNKMKPLDQFYLENHILHLKAAAIGILQEEMKQATNARKTTWRMAIRALRDKL